MSKKDKLIQRLLSRPRDFKYEEAKTLLEGLGFVEDNRGKTSGSRVAFVHRATNNIITMHKRHPDSTLLSYMVNLLIKSLTEQGFIK